jgi:hypothetical protein
MLAETRSSMVFCAASGIVALPTGRPPRAAACLGAWGGVQNLAMGSRSGQHKEGGAADGCNTADDSSAWACASRA